MKKQKSQAISFPKNVVLPIVHFLELEIKRLTKRRARINQADPFSNEARVTENSLEEDVDEQIGHFAAEVKSSFVARQIVQLRKALTRIKLGKYGQCESCGKMIITERLAVKPETTICIECEKERNS